jgi:predicted GIY-YIG superfamily endonuclease
MAERDDIGQHGYVYLVCFAATPLAHAKHYLGATGLELADRMAAHRGERSVFEGKRPGRPAKLLAALQEAGGRFDLVRSWRTGTREQAFELERRLKRTGGSSSAWCPWCHTHEAGPGALRLSRRLVALVREEWLYTPDGLAIMVPHGIVQLAGTGGETEAVSRD